MNDPIQFIDKSNAGDPYIKDFSPKYSDDPKAYTVPEHASGSQSVQSQSSSIRSESNQDIASPPPLQPIPIPSPQVASPPPMSETSASAAKDKNAQTETNGPASTKKT